MIVEISAEAESDLEAIADHITADNPGRARTFVRELREKCANIGWHPRAFPLVERYERVGIRKRVHGNYLIFYRVETKRVVVIHVLNDAMDYERLL